MGSYLFKWDHPASDVYVTGTFDDWGKTIKMDKKGSGHEKVVQLARADQRVLYKFVVDGNWTTDHTVPTETDTNGYSNNILEPHQITPTPIAATTTAAAAAAAAGGTAAAATMSGAADNKTVQSLAGQVPKEHAGSSDLPGSFPETPANEEETVGVNPLPATAGAGNPIKLAAGERVPPASSITSNRIDSAVTTDKAAYEKDAGAPILPDVVTPENERGGGLFGLPAQGKNMIPESSLPVAGGIGTTTINSVGPGATTAALAGQVPLEPRDKVPEVVHESQAEAHAAPEASANPEAVAEKSQVEQELAAKVPEAPAASESTLSGKAAAAVGAAAAGVTAAAAGAAAYVSSGKAHEDAKAKLPEAAHPLVDRVAPKGAATGETAAAGVPPVVKESIQDAHAAPEAAANKTAVAEKSQVESELLETVKTETAAGAPAPTAAAATAATAPAATMKSTATPLTENTAAAAKDDVRDSARATEKTGAKPGSAMAAAQAEATGRSDSRDVSPMTRADGTHAEAHTAPVAAAGAGAAASSSSGPKSPTTDAAKKAKRSSGFFRRIKEKFDHHDKKK